jgi:hypothetical protein
MHRFKNALFGVVVLAAAAALLFLYRMAQHDSNALGEFAASYEHFERAIATPAGDRASDDALADLQQKASMRISSLRANDGSMMRAARDISKLAAQELAALKRSETAQFVTIQQERRRTYERFQRLETAPPNTPY